MLVDCFIFYNEIDVLKKRLRYLDGVVDKFVLVESTVTHRGEEKKLFFDENKKEFEEWSGRIIHVIIRDNPTDKDPWIRKISNGIVLHGVWMNLKMMILSWYLM